MTLPAALPFAGAALRAMRTAAGRRAVHLALVMGGLFALGLLCEGQAHAAEGTPATSAAPVAADASADALRPVTKAVRRLDETVSSTLGHTVQGSPAPDAQRGHPAPPPSGRTPDGKDSVPPLGRHTASPSGSHTVRPGTAPVTRPATSTAPGKPSAPSPATPAAPAASGAPADVITAVAKTVPAVGGTVRQVVRPVAEGVLRPVGEAVVRPVGGLVETVTDGLTEAPAPLPSLPSEPSLPGVPGLLGLSGPQSRPASPAGALPAPSAAQQGGGTDDGNAVEQRETGAYGPRVVLADTTATPFAHPTPHLTRSPYTPPHQAPDSEPTGAYGDRQTADGGAPSQGDGHAVASHHRAPLTLVRGAIAVVTAHGTRDRHRDIPEFPG
ncbi:hypothetical protein ABZ904_36300 [Streptomyces sp. NPDC046900]|uniref:hypothetical protein n=1 Tax=Streptomyces sp. NPDC046900 TaxID=3155473 RepID=UPI0033FCA5E8